MGGPAGWTDRPGAVMPARPPTVGRLVLACLLCLAVVGLVTLLVVSLRTP